MNHSDIVSFLWGVADLIRDTFRRVKYQDAILPPALKGEHIGGSGWPATGSRITWAS